MWTENAKLQDVYDSPEFAQMKGQWISRAQQSGEDDDAQLTLKELQEKTSSWNAKDILFGLHRLQEIAEENERYVYSVYDEPSCEADTSKRQTKLIYMPPQVSVAHKKEICAIFLSGGAYGGVCSLVESIPVAARLNELGITCFCLNYRTATPESFVEGLLPKPLEDIAAAWRFIKDRETQFGVDTNKYFVGGFSAGGHATALWGTETEGYAKYQIPAPQMLLLGYPLITTINLVEGPMRDILRKGMYGALETELRETQFSANLHITEQYPKVYAALCLDDETVPEKDFYDMEKSLQEIGISYRVERGDVGGHGFGLGDYTSVSGWIERAMAFLFEK